MTRKTRYAAVAAAAALVLSACGGGGRQAQQTQPTKTPSPSISPSQSSKVGVPEGVQLSEVGADLAFGDRATVIFEPNQKRGSVLELTVKGATQGTMKDFSSFVLDDKTKASTPYYVDVLVRNVGEGNVGGNAVPLWGVDANNTLLPPATFTTTFSRCPSKALPAKFGPGAKYNGCLVYLAPDKGAIRAVSFRPNEAFDPIEWTGKITTPKVEKKKAPAKEKAPAKKRRRG